VVDDSLRHDGVGDDRLDDLVGAYDGRDYRT